MTIQSLAINVQISTQSCHPLCHVITQAGRGNEVVGAPRAQKEGEQHKGRESSNADGHKLHRVSTNYSHKAKKSQSFSHINTL